MKISLIASSVRHHLWGEFMDSLVDNHDYEVVFAGDLTTFQVRPYLAKYPQLKYIHTSNEIPPCQCYESARRNAIGELINWTADDCEYEPGLLDDVYEYYHSFHNPKALISIKTNENNTNNDLNDHTLLGMNRNTPLMAPLGVMSREYLNKLGGFDRRYCAGQYENKTAMMVYEDGGTVIKYEDGCVRIEHLKKHGSGTKFWKPYVGDRKVLEDDYVVGNYIAPVAGPLLKLNGLKPPTIIWPKGVDNRQVVKKSMTGFFPFPEGDLTKENFTGRQWPPEEEVKTTWRIYEPFQTSS